MAESNHARTDFVAIAALVGGFALVIAFVGLGGDFALDDDWAYGWSARHFAETGQLRILDWAAPSLVSHLAWGGALVRLFGPSFVVLRSGTLVWAALGIVLLYGIGRIAFEPTRAVLLAAAVALSPLYVNLSFTYMTDVPWCVMLLAALWLVLRAERGQWALLFSAGVMLTAAALTRQLAMIVAPAFVVLIAIDWRASSRSLAHGVLRVAIFCAPVVIGYGVFSYWYSHVHGATEAYIETWQRIHLNVGAMISHALATWHYLGFWALPFVIAHLHTRTRETRLSARFIMLTAAVLLAYPVIARLGMVFDATPALGFDAHLPPTFPFLGNVWYALGTGPILLTETYRGRAPWPHRPLWFGYVLTLLSTFGAIYAGAFVATATRRAYAFCKTASPVTPRERERVLFLLTAFLYLGWSFATCAFMFDRYLLPMMPIMIWLVLDITPPMLARSPVVIACLAVIALFSAAATREWLALGAARTQAFNELRSRGIAASNIDGGFELNGPLHFQEFFATHHELLNGKHRHVFWLDAPEWELSTATRPGCEERKRYPFWTWAPTRTNAILVLQCSPEASR